MQCNASHNSRSRIQKRVTSIPKPEDLGRHRFAPIYWHAFFEMYVSLFFSRKCSRNKCVTLNKERTNDDSMPKTLHSIDVAVLNFIAEKKFCFFCACLLQLWPEAAEPAECGANTHFALTAYEKWINVGISWQFFSSVFLRAQERSTWALQWRGEWNIEIEWYFSTETQRHGDYNFPLRSRRLAFIQMEDNNVCTSANERAWNQMIYDEIDFRTCCVLASIINCSRDHSFRI